MVLTRTEALRAWGRIVDALTASELAEDHRLAGEIRGFVQRQAMTQLAAQIQQRQREQQRQRQQDTIRTEQPTRQAERRPLARDATSSRGPEGPEIIADTLGPRKQSKGIHAPKTACCGRTGAAGSV